MKTLILSVLFALSSSAAFAQTTATVCEKQVSFDKLCNPMIEGHRAHYKSNATEVCDRLHYPRGAVDDSVVSTTNKAVFPKRRDREEYVGTIRLNGRGKASHIYEDEKEPAIYSIICNK